MKPNRRYHKTAGFTLIEMMTTMAIGAVIMAGVPSLTTIVRNSNLTMETNSLVTDINLARSEAIKRGVRVILCRSADPNAAAPSCGGSANTWTTGWLVFASGDGDNTYTAGVDTLIRIGNPPSGSSMTIKTNNTSDNNLEYNSNGTTNEGGGTAVFALCDDRNEIHGNQIQVDPRGRPRLIKGSPNEPIPNCSSPSAA